MNNSKKEFTVELRMYLPVRDNETVEEMIDRTLMMFDPDVEVWLYEETAEIRDL